MDALLSFQLIKMFQPSEYDLLGRLLDLACQEDLIKDGVDLLYLISTPAAESITLTPLPCRS